MSIKPERIFPHPFPVYPVTHIALGARVIIDMSGDYFNADLEFLTGWVNQEGLFVSFGMDRIHLEDSPPIYGADGNTLVSPGKTDYMDFFQALCSSSNPEEVVVQTILTKVTGG